jgi:hypothetical protein
MSRTNARSGIPSCAEGRTKTVPDPIGLESIPMTERQLVELERNQEQIEPIRRVVDREVTVPELMQHEWEEQIEPVWRRLPLMADWIEHYGV